MVDRGELETRGRYVRPNSRRESIEAAKQRGPAISPTTAARLLGRSPNFLRDLIAASELTSFSNPKWPVFRLEVERYAKEHPPPPPGSPPVSPQKASSYGVLKHLSSLVATTSRLGVGRLMADTGFPDLPPRYRGDARTTAATGKEMCRPPVVDIPLDVDSGQLWSRAVDVREDGMCAEPTVT
jgi:hypothetical protein